MAPTNLSAEQGAALLGKRVRKHPYLSPMSPLIGIVKAVTRHGLVEIECPHCAHSLGYFDPKDLEEWPHG